MHHFCHFRKRWQYTVRQHTIHILFVMGNMNLIYTLAGNSEYLRIQQLSRLLSDYMRYALRVDQTEITLSDEVKYLKDYLTIVQFNYPDSIQFQILCDDRLNRYRVPTYILNTVLENSIEHGFSANHGNLKIKIQIDTKIEESQEFLLVCISDNGVGYPEDMIRDINNFQNFSDYFSSHIGLRNVKARLYLNYGLTDGLTIRNQDCGGALTQIKIPVS